MRLKSFAVLFLVCLATPAYAYIGPGLGAGTIGVILGILASIILGIFAVVWYPLKRLLKKIKKTPDDAAPGVAGASGANVNSKKNEGQ